MAMTLVSTVTVGSGGAASITFSSISNTGKDLLLLLHSRSTDSTGNAYIRFNSDTTMSNYNQRLLFGSGSTTGSTTGTSYYPNFMTGNSGQTSNTFGSTAIYISNYTSSVAKSISIDSVNENNATAARQEIIAATWSGTAAISGITTVMDSGGVYAENTTASLYLIS